MSTTGIFNSSNFTPKQVAPSFSSKLLQMMPNGTAPLLAFSSQLQETTLTNTRHSWFFQDYLQPQAIITGTLPAAVQNAVTTIATADAGSISEGMVLVVDGTMEQVLVVGVVGDAIAIRRGVGTTAPATAAAGTVLTQVGTAFEESSLRPMPQTRSMVEAHNITQIFRNTWAVSGTAKSILTQVGDGAAATNMRDAMMFHGRDIELALLFGEQYSGTLKGQPLRKMGGIRSLIEQYAPQNIVQAPKVTTYDDLEVMLDPLFNVVTDQSNVNDRLIFTDSVGANALSRLGRQLGVLQIQQGQTAFGQRFTSFSAGRGQFKVMEHPLFNTLGFAKGMMFVVDLSSMSVGYLNGRKTDYKEFNPNANSSSGVSQDGGIDAQGGAYLTELTCLINAPAANGLILGLCDVGVRTQVTVANTFGSLVVDRPCLAGKVQAGDVVNLTVKSVASTGIKVMTPTGQITITTNAQGVGTATYTAGSSETQVFEIVPNAAITGVTYSPAHASICVDQGCSQVFPAEAECGGDTGGGSIEI